MKNKSNTLQEIKCFNKLLKKTYYHINLLIFSKCNKEFFGSQMSFYQIVQRSKIISFIVHDPQI